MKAEIKHTAFALDWNSDFPNHGGVYVLWENEVPIYVGETSNIRKRMSDLMQPINYTSTKRKSLISNSVDLIELRKYISANYKLSCIQIDFGGVEVRNT